MTKRRGRGGATAAAPGGPSSADTTASSAQAPAPAQKFTVEKVEEATPEETSKEAAEHKSEKTRPEVMAERKSKAEAKKAAKAGKAQANKAANAGSDGAKAASESQKCEPKPTAATTDGKSREELVAAQKAAAIAARAAKAAKEKGVAQEESIEKLASDLGGMSVDKKGDEKSREEVLAARKAKNAAKADRASKAKDNDVEGDKSEKQKNSVLKAANQQSSQSERGVRFGMASTQSEENLLIALKHAEEKNTNIADPSCDLRDKLHPRLRELLEEGEAGRLSCLDELCQAFLANVKEFILDEVREAEGDSPLGAKLEQALQHQITAITCNDRSPLPYALGNLVRQLRKELLTVGVVDERTGRATGADDVVEWLEDCARSNFSLAEDAISQHLIEKIRAASKILTFDWCPVVNRVLRDATARGDVKQLCILDAVKNGPAMRHMSSLSSYDGYVEYGDLTAAGSAFEAGSLLLLGCSAVLSSGRLSLPRGAAQLALVARAHNVPVLVLAPTYKFVDKAQSQSRQALLGRLPQEVLPPDLVTAIVTEIRLLPPSSAPAVLKAKALEDAG